MPNQENIAGQGFHTNPERINKAGRPKGSRSLGTILREMLEAPIEVVVEGKKEKRQMQEVIIRKLLKEATDGNIRAITEIFDRVEGKAKQTMEVTAQIEQIKIVEPGS